MRTGMVCLLWSLLGLCSVSTEELECVDCSKCRRSTPVRMTKCKEGETCWVFQYTHGTAGKPRNTNTHRRCEPRQPEPPMNKCMESKGSNFKGLICQCDFSGCNRLSHPLNSARPLSPCPRTIYEVTPNELLSALTSFMVNGLLGRRLRMCT